MTEPIKTDEVKIQVEHKPKPAEKPFPIKYDERIFTTTFSEHLGDIALAMSKAQGAMYNGEKDKQGYGYKYMTLANLTDIIRPHLTANELTLIQTHETIKRPNTTTVLTTTRVIHSSGQWIQNKLELPVTPMKQLSPCQLCGIPMTYARRYALQALFMISSEEDTDGA